MKPLVYFLLSILLAETVHASEPAGEEFFEKKVRPLLVAQCLQCHGAEGKKIKGELRVSSRESLLKGGSRGPALVPGAPGESLLIQAIRYTDEVRMPPKGKLKDDEIAILVKWVQMNAPWPKETQTSAVAKSGIGKNPREHWAWQPLSTPLVPRIKDSRWPRTFIDPFILAALEARNMAPALPAGRRTLARRLYFDLVGLPPTFEEAEAFSRDTSPAAYKKLVDKLLASPHFGEKWGRHWLDVARYAEDHSTSESTCKPPRYPFQYRDWVIAAFNADLPYDEFVRRQLAADLMPPLPPKEYAALGFLGLSPVYHKEPKLSKEVISEIVADEWDERVDVVTRGFLGLTVSCARCHDHKFDPISTEDYYALAGIMANTQLAERPLRPDAEADEDIITTVRKDLQDMSQRLEYAKEMKETALKEKTDAAVFEKQIKELKPVVALLTEREKSLYNGPTANVVRDAATFVNGEDPAFTTIDYWPGQLRDLPVFLRGNPSKPGPIVPRRFPRILSKGEAKPFHHGSGRLELAEAIVGDAAGLTARVYVNRVWGWVFGNPLVTSPSNFGLLGDRPSHPELLEALASRFVANGWSVKWLIREMVLSAAYCQSSRHDENCARLDADNRLLWRAHRKRLELEQWRDAILQVSGQMDGGTGGPSQNLDSAASLRRTVYGKVSRQRLSDIHRLFDLPDPKFHGEKRDATTTPIQQLYFLNSPFVRQASLALAKRVAGKEHDPVSIARALYRQVLLREPTAQEIDMALDLVQPTKTGQPLVWEVLAQVLLASNEFLFLSEPVTLGSGRTPMRQPSGL